MSAYPVSAYPRPSIWRFLWFVLTLPGWIVKAAAHAYWVEQFERYDKEHRA